MQMRTLTHDDLDRFQRNLGPQIPSDQTELDVMISLELTVSEAQLLIDGCRNVLRTDPGLTDIEAEDE